MEIRAAQRANAVRPNWNAHLSPESVAAAGVARQRALAAAAIEPGELPAYGPRIAQRYGGYSGYGKQARFSALQRAILDRAERLDH